jgi:electron transfer flavoprotein alpha subunit
MLRNAIRPAVRNAAGRLSPVFQPIHLSQLRHLLSTLAILEQREGQLIAGSLNTITAAKKLGGSVHAFVAGSNVGPAAQEASQAEGVEKVLVVNNGAYEKVRDLLIAPVLTYALGFASLAVPCR